MKTVQVVTEQSLTTYFLFFRERLKILFCKQRLSLIFATP